MARSSFFPDDAIVAWFLLARRRHPGVSVPKPAEGGYKLTMKWLIACAVLVGELGPSDALSSRTMIAHGLTSCEDSSSIASRVEQLEGPKK